MNWIFRFLFMIIGAQVKKSVVHEAKRKGVVAYLRVLQGSRLFFVVCLAAFLILQAMMISFFGLLVTGLLLWDHDFAAKIEILFYIFLALFSVPFLVLIVITSERFWYKMSGAARLVDDLQND